MLCRLYRRNKRIISSQQAYLCKKKKDIKVKLQQNSNIIHWAAEQHKEWGGCKTITPVSKKINNHWLPCCVFSLTKAPCWLTRENQIETQFSFLWESLARCLSSALFHWTIRWHKEKRVLTRSALQLWEVDQTIVQRGKFHVCQNNSE